MIFFNVLFGFYTKSICDEDIAGFKFLGENLAKGASKVKSVTMWYDEIKDTPGGKGKETTFNPKTGHYTQVVWKEVTKVGCGETAGMVCCMYGIGGNMQGEYKTNVLPVDSSKKAECQGNNF